MEVFAEEDSVEEVGDGADVEDAEDECGDAALFLAFFSFEDVVEKVDEHDGVADPVHVGVVEECPEDLPVGAAIEAAVQKLEGVEVEPVPENAEGGEKAEDEEGDEEVGEDELAKIYFFFALHIGHSLGSIAKICVLYNLIIRPLFKPRRFQ